MRVEGVNDDQTVDLAHQGHRFRAALGSWAYARADDGTADRAMLVSGPLVCLDGDGYACVAYFPLLGEADAQRLHARAAAAFGEYATEPDAARATVVAIHAKGGVVRFDPDRA